MIDFSRCFAYRAFFRVLSDRRPILVLSRVEHVRSQTFSLGDLSWRAHRIDVDTSHGLKPNPVKPTGRSTVPSKRPPNVHATPFGPENVYAVLVSNVFLVPPLEVFLLRPYAL